MSLKQQTIQALTKRIWFGSGAAIDWPAPLEMMGIELEAENVRNTGGNFLGMAGWTIDSDGSLRNQGREFVLTQPLSGSALSRAIHTLFAMQAEDSPYRMTYTPNPRAGTHIHINWLDNTVGAAAALLALMYCIEPLVYAWADEDRAWCSYCNPLSDLPAAALSSLLDVENDRTPNDEDEDEEDSRWLMREADNETVGRYHGLNITALLKYGTMEFRYFPSTTKREDMVAWVKFVQLAKLCALKYEDNLVVLLDRLAEGNVAEFLATHFNVDDIANGLLTSVNDADYIVKEKADELLTIMGVRPMTEERYGSNSPAARRYFDALGVTVQRENTYRVIEEYDGPYTTESVPPLPEGFTPYRPERRPAVVEPSLTLGLGQRVPSGTFTMPNLSDGIGDWYANALSEDNTEPASDAPPTHSHEYEQAVYAEQMQQARAALQRVVRQQNERMGIIVQDSWLRENTEGGEL